MSANSSTREGQQLSDGSNPYAAPPANVQTGNSGLVPPEIMLALTATRPWVRFISIVMWIGCAMLLLFMALGIYFAIAAIKTDGQQVEFPATALAIPLGYGFIVLLLIYPTLKLSKYASNIARLADSRSFSDLAAALTDQRHFWKFSGILTLLYVCLALLLFVGSFFVHRVPSRATPPSLPTRNT